MHDLGQAVIYAGFIVSLFGAVVGLLGSALRRPAWMEASKVALFGLLALYGVASMALLYSLLTHDFANKYVATYTDVDMPVAYLIAAFWGGEKGALLFWVLVLTGFSVLAVRKNKDRDAAYVSCATGILHSAILFFNILMVFESSPFEAFITFDGPADGKGMNPLLQNPVMTIHPPCMLTGYIAFTIPFAFGLAALLVGKLDDDWAKDTRVWTIVSWLFLTTGLILGGMWAYEELGWGGYWAWDPVENAGLIPWFTGTAFLHSVMIQERRGMLRRWNFFLVLLTFLLTIFGTFLTRSQLIDSIHAFADSTLAEYFLWYMLAIVVVSAYALGRRWREMAPESRIEHFLSRESFFVLNNLFLLACAFVVLWGTVFSKVSELESVQAMYNAVIGVYNATPLATWFGGAEEITQAIVLGEAWFNRVMVPIGLVLLLLTGIGPVISWRRATAKNFNKNMRGPLVVSLIATCAGGLLWAGIRIVDFFETNTRMLQSAWLLDSRNAVSTGKALPPFESYNVVDAFGAWSATLSSLDVYAFLCFLFSAFVLSSIGVEFVRGARILARKHGGGVLWNMGLLTMKNRRRYGGYIIHIGVVFAFLAFAGAVFKSENPEAVLYPGERTQIADYHLTLTGLQDEYIEDGAYVATQAPMVVIPDGETVPHGLVDKLVGEAEDLGLGGFSVDTFLNSPKVRFVPQERQVEWRTRALMDDFFRATFSYVKREDRSRSLFFRPADIRVVQVMPPSLHRNLNRVRDAVSDPAIGGRVLSNPGTPVFEIRFADVAKQTAFLEAFEKPPMFSETQSVAWVKESGAVDVVPKGFPLMLYPEVRTYKKHDSPTTEIAIWSKPYEDIYVAMRPAIGQPFVNALVVVFPLVSFLWTGALVMILGGIICLLPTELAANLFRTAPRPAAGVLMAGQSLALRRKEEDREDESK